MTLYKSGPYSFPNARHRKTKAMKSRRTSKTVWSLGDTGCEFCAPDPTFKLVVVLSSCGYGLSVIGVLDLRAVEVFAGHLERRV